MIALLIQSSKGPARAAMDAPLLRLIAAIEEARGYSPEEIAALRPNVARAVRALRKGRFPDLHGWLGGARPPEIPGPALEALAVMRELGTVPSGRPKAMSGMSAQTAVVDAESDR